MASSSPNRASSYRDPKAARLTRAVRGLTSLIVLAVCLLAGRANAQVPGGVAGPAAAETDEPLVLALRLENTPIDVVIQALDRGTRVMVPLGELCRALDLAIEVDPGRGVAEGFFLSESRRFRLDAASRRIESDQRSLAWDSVGIVLRPDDIYVSTALFHSWFGLELDADRHAAILGVRSATPLPIQARAERQRRIEAALGGPELDVSGYRRVRAPYALWSTPFVDQELRTWAAAGYGKRASEWQSTSYLAGDLLYMESDLYVSGSRSDPLAEVHGGLGRRDPDPTLLGPLRAREFRVGEVAYPGLALVTRANSAPGFMVSNFPLERPSQFGEHTFQGRLPAGWDVELYRDDGLIAYQESRPDGTYAFEGVPLMFGFNQFRLVFNGPHGERHEERRTFNVGPSLTPSGSLQYRLVASGLGDSTMRAHLEMDVHLAGNLSGSFAIASARFADRMHQFASTGARGYWRHFFAGADAAVDQAGAGVLQMEAQARTRRIAASVRHDRVSDGFESDAFRSSFGRIARRTSVLLDGQLAPRRTFRIPVQVELTRESDREGRSALAWADRLGLAIGRVSLSYQTRWVLTRDAGTGAVRQTQGGLLASTRIRRWSVHGTFDNLLGERGGPRSIQISADGPAFKSVFAGLGVMRDAWTGGTRMTADLSTDQGVVGWTARIEGGGRAPFGLSVALRMGLDHEPRHGDWHAGARPVTGTGAASAQVFLDANGNGARDMGEEPIPGVQLMLNHAVVPGRTDDRGVLFLSGLPGREEVDLELSPSSLEDPMWVARDPGLRVVPRTGNTTLVDFPVVISGEVAGTVSVKHPDGPKPAAGITLELVDAVTGKIVQRIATAYDGYFDLLAIPPGRYQLRVAATQLRRLGVSTVPARTIEITPAGSQLEGIDIVIQPDAAADESR